MTSPYLWFQLCGNYLNRVEAFDNYTRMIDNMHPTTKNEFDLKMIHMASFMRIMKEKKDLEDELDELWSIKHERT